MTKRAPVNLLGFVEAGPHRAREVAVVSDEKRVGKIVSRAGFAGDAELS